MEVPLIGFILLPLAVYWFCFRPDFLYWAMIFSIPFSATAVINLDFSGARSGVQATIIFGALWLLREGSHLFRKSAIAHFDSFRKSTRWLAVFMFIVVLSLAMPILIAGRITIECPDLNCIDSVPLSFGMRHITQTVYLAYGVVLTVFIALRNSDLRRFKQTLRVFLAGSLFVSFWGFLQWFCYHAGTTYPSFLFNSSETESALGYMQEIGELGVARISSAATEPSMLAQAMLVALVFASFAVFARRPLFSWFWDRVALVVFVVILLISTSSTAYLGLALYVPIAVFAFWYLGRLKLGNAVIAAAVIVALYSVYAGSSLAQDVIDKMIFTKAEGSSGLGRIASLFLAFEYFRSYPVLGIGWGSAPSLDMIFKILSNTGILGLLAFGLFVRAIFVRLWKSVTFEKRRKAVSDRAYWSCCLLVAVVMLLATNEISGFAFVYGHPWLVFGLALALPVLRIPVVAPSPSPQLQPRPTSS